VIGKATYHGSTETRGKDRGLTAKDAEVAKEEREKQDGLPQIYAEGCR
jgi:hypothetical protein